MNSGKIIIMRSLSKPLVIEQEDIRQISVTKNENYSLRWLYRLVYFIVPLLFALTILNDYLKDLKSSALDYTKLSSFLMQLSTLTIILVVLHNGELITHYQQVIKIDTRSNLKLEFFTDKPEEIMSILKIENS